MSNFKQKNREIFENLFVLELANNHWGSLERGLKIIYDHGNVARVNNIKAAIKLQGIGLHTGEKVNLEICPAPDNHGYKFQRTDLEGEPNKYQEKFYKRRDITQIPYQML